MSISEYISPVLGRIAIAWFFLSEAWSKLSDFAGTVAVLHAAHVPAPAPLLVVGLTLVFLGAAALVFGFHARHGAVLLFATTVIVSVILHAWWNLQDTGERAAAFDLFLRNMAVAGGLLLLVGMGPGPIALDNLGGRRT